MKNACAAAPHRRRFRLNPGVSKQCTSAIERGAHVIRALPSNDAETARDSPFDERKFQASFRRDNRPRREPLIPAASPPSSSTPPCPFTSSPVLSTPAPFATFRFAESACPPFRRWRVSVRPRRHSSLAQLPLHDLLPTRFEISADRASFAAFPCEHFSRHGRNRKVSRRREFTVGGWPAPKDGIYLQSNRRQSKVESMRGMHEKYSFSGYLVSMDRSARRNQRRQAGTLFTDSYDGIGAEGRSGPGSPPLAVTLALFGLQILVSGYFIFAAALSGFIVDSCGERNCNFPLIEFAGWTAPLGIFAILCFASGRVFTTTVSAVRPGGFPSGEWEHPCSCYSSR